MAKINPRHSRFVSFSFNINIPDMTMNRGETEAIIEASTADVNLRE